jgi:hypothetical protein
MRHHLLLLLAALTLPLAALAQPARGVGYPTVAAALDALKARKNVAITDQRGWTIVEDEPARAIWSFTPPGHPAHPAVVKRTVVERDGTVGMQMTALCQADKEACDKLMEEFKALNAQMSAALPRTTLSPSDIAVRRLGDDAYQLVLTSRRSKTVEAGQDELEPKAQELCGAKSFIFGKFEFDTVAPMLSSDTDDAKLVLKQMVACGDVAATQVSAPQSLADKAWQPAAAQVQVVERQSKAYFAAKDARRYQDAYQMLAPTFAAMTPYERWKSVVDDAQSQTGAALHRDIRKITWYKNPPQAKPGTYAAVDVAGQFANADFHCSVLVWVEQADGGFRLIREETNFMDKATEKKLKPEERQRILTQFGCKGPG